eukprot:4860323-Prymnesium_polylepis.1
MTELLLAYDLPRVECLQGLFRSAERGTASASSMRPVDGATSCLDSVGVRMRPDRQAAALRSEGSLADLFHRVESARAMTVELWLRMAPSATTPADSYDEDGENAVQPILVLGSAAAAERGLSGSGCDEGQYAFMVAQQGDELRVEVARSLRGRNGALAATPRARSRA